VGGTNADVHVGAGAGDSGEVDLIGDGNCDRYETTSNSNTFDLSAAACWACKDEDSSAADSS
jgi:hypothetical protein